jgi:hypothetical protein
VPLPQPGPPPQPRGGREGEREQADEQEEEQGKKNHPKNGTGVPTTVPAADVRRDAELKPITPPMRAAMVARRVNNLRMWCAPIEMTPLMASWYLDDLDHRARCAEPVHAGWGFRADPGWAFEA